MKLSLSGSSWEVQGFWPWVPLWRTSAELGQEMLGITGWLPAQVPGGVHTDLLAAGWIPDPLVRMQSMLGEWVEHRWWVYRTVVECPTIPAEHRAYLVFEGLDDEAWVWVNQQCLGHHRGPFEPVEYDVTPFFIPGESLRIQVVFHHVPDEMGQIGKTSSTATQKSRFGYKWDFGTRLVNIGIWQDAYIETRPPVSLEDVYVKTDVSPSGVGSIAVTVQTTYSSESEQAPGVVEVSCYDPSQALVSAESITVDRETHQAQINLSVPHPQLWFPNGYGAQPLYRVSVRLTVGDREVDRRIIRTGLRKLSYVHNDGHPEALPYVVVVNNQRVYIKGVNITPLDHVYGSVTSDQYKNLVVAMRDANVNLVRINGVGVIEKEVLYDLCDEMGIMIWQELIQTSSGIDNTPSRDPRFLELLQRTAVAAFKQKRNHVSLVLWDGGNELTEVENRPVSYSDPVIAALKVLADQWDPDRLFLPTSASGPTEYVSDRPQEGHDVHGHWQYLGNPRHYTFYAAGDYLFHSEFGASGLASLPSIRRILQEETPAVRTMQTDSVWRWHGEWWDTQQRDTALFGTIEDLPAFVAASQWVQAEAVRFVIEANRRRKFVNSGSIVWQLNEPWPNIANTSLIEYFGARKMAFYWVRRAFSPMMPSLAYERLDFAEGSRFTGTLWINVDAPTANTTMTIRVRVYNQNGFLYHETTYPSVVDDPNAATRVGDLEFPVTERLTGIFLVRLELFAGDADRREHLVGHNEYMFSTDASRPFGAALQMAQSRLHVTAETDWLDAGDPREYRRRYVVSNTGQQVALHVHAVERTDHYWMRCSESFFSLVPGETAAIDVTVRAKRCGGLLAGYWPKETEEPPEVDFISFPGE